jgi:uncharacterized protein (TIRG00374 family)
MVIALILAAGLLYLALRKVNWSELLLTLRQGNLALLGLAVIILTTSCLVRALRWRILLMAEEHPERTSFPFLPVFWATMAGYLGNSYLPARAGEVIRSLLIGQKANISKSFSLATALTERIVDAIILVVVCALALSTLPVIPPAMVGALKGMGILGIVGAVAVFVAPRMSGLVHKIISLIPVPVNIREKIGGIVDSFLMGAGALQNWGRLFLFLLCSVGIWTLDTINSMVVAQAFGLSLNPIQLFILLAALGLASAIPSTPGYVGVYQFVAVTVLVPFGLSEAQAVAYILAFQGIQYIGITLWGLIGLWQLRGAIRF